MASRFHARRSPPQTEQREQPETSFGADNRARRHCNRALSTWCAMEARRVSEGIHSLGNASGFHESPLAMARPQIKIARPLETPYSPRAQTLRAGKDATMIRVLSIVLPMLLVSLAAGE